jgi:hypothetical protein
MNNTSEEFKRAFGSVGTPCFRCHCGRFCFADEACDVSEEDLKGWKEGRKEHPDKNIAIDGNAILVAEIDGIGIAVDCPCDGLKKYEDFILAHRREIITYLKAVATRKAKEAKSFQEELDGALTV